VAFFIPFLPAIVGAADIGVEFISQQDPEIDGCAIDPYVFGGGDGAGVMVAFEGEGEGEGFLSVHR